MSKFPWGEKMGFAKAGAWSHYQKKVVFVALNVTRNVDSKWFTFGLILSPEEKKLQKPTLQISNFKAFQKKVFLFFFFPSKFGKKL